MGKNTYFFGQPVYGKLIKSLDRDKLDLLYNKCNNVNPLVLSQYTPPNTFMKLIHIAVRNSNYNTFVIFFSISFLLPIFFVTLSRIS